MDEINKMRKDFFTHGENRSEIAKKFNRSWDTVDRIVKMDRNELENRGKRPNRPRTVMTQEVMKAIEHYFKEEETKGVKKKQRYTGKQIYQELKSKGIYHGSKRRMQEVVSMLRQKRGEAKKPTFLPLEFPPGSALQIDHGEAHVEIGDSQEKGYLFVASVPGEVLRYSQIFPVKSSEAWGEFHERAFNFFGGVFSRAIYDNDTVLVKKVIGNDRQQTSFSLSLEEHYGFESHFCNLGAGHEKGAVENGVGYCRRRFLAGYPSFSSWEEANSLLSACCKKDIKQGTHYKTKERLFDLFQKTQGKLNPLPLKKQWCRWVSCRVDQCQLITVDQRQYSVPEKFVGCSLRVAVTIARIEVYSDKEKIADHKRQYGKADSLEVDHYLDQLIRKPRALSYAKVVVQNRFHPNLMEMWGRLLEKYGQKEANRQFASILLLRRQACYKDLLIGVEKALKWDAISSDAVETIIRQNQLEESSKKEREPSPLIPVREAGWEFSLAPYGELCMERAL